MDWVRNTKTGEIIMRRRQLRHEGRNPQLAVFEWSKSGRLGTRRPCRAGGLVQGGRKFDAGRAT